MERCRRLQSSKRHIGENMSEAIDYPKYPCVAFGAVTRQTTYDKTTGAKIEQTGPEILFFPVTGVDDLESIHHNRRRKQWPVLGYANLEKIVEASPRKAQEVRMLKQELDMLVNPPELRRANESRRSKSQS